MMPFNRVTIENKKMARSNARIQEYIAKENAKHDVNNECTNSLSQ